MFDIGATEVLLIVVVAILVIGPSDMPSALRQAGRWIGKMRRMSGHFRTGLDAMIREAEMEDMEKKWKAQNEKIMRQHPDGGPAEMEPTGAYPAPKAVADNASQAGSPDAASPAAPAPPPAPASAPATPAPAAEASAEAGSAESAAKPAAKDTPSAPESAAKDGTKDGRAAD